MATGNILIQCDLVVRDLLCGAIRDYALAAYPPGGSECAQVARYTLLELATRIEQGISTDDGTVEISRRPRAMVKAALEYFCDRFEQGAVCGSARQRALLATLLQGQRVTASELAQARAEDAGAAPPT